jgi:hypothetical protein
MKVKIKSFDEIVNDFSTRFSLKPSFIELLKFVFLNSGKTISFDKKEYDSNLTLNLCYIKDGITIPSHIVEKELPAEPETTEPPKITADTIRKMQNKLTNDDYEKLLKIIGDIARSAPTSDSTNFYLGYLLNESICNELTRRGFTVTTRDNNIQQSTCISW